MRPKHLFASALLAVLSTACATYDPPSAAEGHALSQAGIRPGFGFIDSVAVVRGARAESAGAGGSAPDRNAYRLFLRMDNGGSQTIDQDNPTFMAGERVQITPDGRIVRPPQGF
jgi:hypothetical protein